MGVGGGKEGRFSLFLSGRGLRLTEFLFKGRLHLENNGMLDDEGFKT